MTNNTNIHDTALSLVGKLKYKWGADNIAGGYGDCSDFTQYVYERNGIDIGGDTQAQYVKSKATNSPMQGDLVFFKDTYQSNKIYGVSHVGIVKDNDTFIQLGEKGCTVERFDNPYWKKHFLGFRRVDGINYIDKPFPDENKDVESTVEITDKPVIAKKITVGVLIVLLCIVCLILLMAMIGLNIGGVTN